MKDISGFKSLQKVDQAKLVKKFGGSAPAAVPGMWISCCHTHTY